MTNRSVNRNLFLVLGLLGFLLASDFFEFFPPTSFASSQTILNNDDGGDDDSKPKLSADSGGKPTPAITLPPSNYAADLCGRFLFVSYVLTQVPIVSPLGADPVISFGSRAPPLSEIA